VRDASGRARHVLAVVEDVTERRRNEEALQVANERLRRLDEERTRFVNLMAHELRGPMTPILLRFQLLKRPDVSPEQQRRSLDVLERNLRRLDTLLEQLLDVARIESGRLPLHPAPADLVALVREALELHGPAAAEAGVTLEARGLAEPAPLRADPMRLGQVLGNLLGNALKFTPSGGTVRVRVERHDGRYALAVEDTGVGLSPQQLEQLFRPFSQAHGAARGGTGLGLFISRAIVEGHGGRIVASSPGPGQGSSFVVELPAAGVPE